MIFVGKPPELAHGGMIAYDDNNGGSYFTAYTEFIASVQYPDLNNRFVYHWHS